MALWFRKSEANEEPVSSVDCLVMVKQISAVFFSGVKQFEF